MKLILVRHGKDAEGYRGGWSREDLTEEGIWQAKLLAAHLKEHGSIYNVTHILSSDLPRAMSTAKHIASALGLEIQPEPCLRETDNGALAGMPNETALQRYPGVFFSTLDMDESYPGGESPRTFFLRVRDWFLAFCAEYADREGNVLAVTHGGVINVICHLVKGIEWSNQSPAFRTANCGIYVLDVESMEFEAENRVDFLTI